MPRSNNMALPNAQRVATAEASGAPTSTRRRWFRPVFLLPAIVFLGLMLAFGFSLHRDPNTVPSAFIGKPVPEFSLAPVKGRALCLSSANLKSDVSLVNVFASWCVACREEHPLLMRMEERRLVPIYGLDYKDKPGDAAPLPRSRGDPFPRQGAPIHGRAPSRLGR